MGQELPGAFRELCGCVVTEYDAIGPVYQRLRTMYGGTYRISGGCDLLKLETARPWAKYEDQYYAGTPAITQNACGKGICYYVGTIGEKAMYRSLILEILREQGIDTLEQLPQGVESTVRSGKGGHYRFFFNNTLDGIILKFNEGKVYLDPMEMKILSGDGTWV